MVLLAALSYTQQQRVFIDGNCTPPYRQPTNSTITNPGVDLVASLPHPLSPTHSRSEVCHYYIPVSCLNTSVQCLCLTADMLEAVVTQCVLPHRATVPVLA